MSDIIIYMLIGAGIAFLFLILFKLFSGREKKSKAYSYGNKQAPFPQTTELYDSSLETKKHIKSASRNISMIGEIVPMLEAGNKIAAIKHVQEKEHMSLHDAKAFVDRAEEVMHKMPSLFNFKENGQETGENLVFNSNLSSVDLQIKELIEGGNLISAIKVYREATNCSLLEAKEYCEEFARKNNLFK